MDWTSGLYSDSLHGKHDLLLCDIRRWTGELPYKGVDKFIHSVIAFHRSAS